jgi:hypothetical protein
MTVERIREFLFSCNRCGAFLAHKTTQDKHDLPEGWQTYIRETHGCGLTGYTSRDTCHTCPDCPAPTEGD